MNAKDLSTKPATRLEPAAYEGRVVYLFAFDLAYEMIRRPLDSFMGQPIAEFSMDASKRNPRHLMFFRPQMVRLPPLERLGPMGPLTVERSIKFLPVGAISITMSVPFRVKTIDELIVFHDLQFKNGSLEAEVRLLAEQARTELADYLIRPSPRLIEEEAYTVFCIHAPLQAAAGDPLSTEAWFETHRAAVAALLTQEPNVNLLSRQESEESTGRYLSYYQNDLAVVDWDATLLIDEPTDLDDTLYVMELANLQLAELEAYDLILDQSLERAYRDLRGRYKRPRREVMRELREIRIDSARLGDELSNITKFFGDWHLARIYEVTASRFHLADWHKTFDEKSKTLDDLYQMLNHDQNNRWMLILEVTIVVLFVLDLFLVYMVRHG